ncbi:MAG: hypothetical protein AAFN91_13520, partial [Pseudomonadota bacterium]
MMLNRSLIGSAMSCIFVLASCASIETTTTPEPLAQPMPAVGAKNVILMVSDGIGFNGWLAADYYQGLAGNQSYQIMRPDGTEPVIYGMTHDSLNLIDAS